MPKAQVKSENGTSTFRLTLDNDLTIYTAAELKQTLLNGLEQANVIELDLTRVAEIDSSGLQVLLLVKRESLTVGKELHIVGHSPAVHELLDFFNVASYFGDPLVIPATARA